MSSSNPGPEEKGGDSGVHKPRSQPSAEAGFEEIATPLRNNFLWILLGRGVQAASLWGIVIVLAKLGSAEMVGSYALAIAVSAPVVLFCELKLREVQASDANDLHHFRDYLSLRFFMLVLALLVITGIAFGSGYSGDVLLVILAVGFCKAVESLSDILFGLMQKHEKMQYISISLALKGMVSFGAVTLTLVLFHSLLWAVAAMLATYLTILLVFDLRNARRVLNLNHSGANDQNDRGWCQWRKLRTLAQLAFPLGLGAAVASLTLNIPRYLLARYHGESALGYFAAISYLPFAGTLAIEAMGQSALPRLARYYQEDLPAYRSLLAKILGLALVFGLGGVLFAILLGSRFLALAYRPEYVRYSGIFTWMMGAGCMLYLCSIIGIGLTAGRALKVQMRIAMAVFAGSVLAALSLIPAYAERGATWSFLVACSLWLGLDATAVLPVMWGSSTVHAQTLPVPSKVG